MDSSVSPEDEIWFLHVCHHISTGIYYVLGDRDSIAENGRDLLLYRSVQTGA
jgi:hypothetical protein